VELWILFGLLQGIFINRYLDTCVLKYTALYAVTL